MRPALHNEYPQRIARARTLMKEQGLDGLLLFTGPNLIYFTGMPCGRSGSPFSLAWSSSESSARGAFGGQRGLPTQTSRSTFPHRPASKSFP